MQKRKVYIVSPGGRTARGGIGRMVDYFVRSWTADDLRLTVVDSYGPGPKWLMPLYFMRAYVHVLVALIAGRVDLLHIHMSERLSVPRKGAFVFTAAAFGVPVVMHLHGADFLDDYNSRSRLGRSFVRNVLNHSRVVLCLGSFWKQTVIEHFGLAPDKVQVMHNAVPVGAVVESSPALAAETACKILFLGIVSERKGVPCLLQALAHPDMRALDWGCTFAGNGEVETYRKAAEALGLGARVRFTGWLCEREARETLSRADIVVLPSRNEGLPMAILEAMSLGRAIVATPVGAIPDAIVNEETGLITPVGDAAALAAALSQLIKAPTLRHNLGEKAKQRFLKEFEISAYNDRLAEIYRVCCGAPRQQDA